MLIQKIFALLMVIIWLVLLAFVCGPVRWDFSHTYAHWIEGLGIALPRPTLLIGLPILGLAYPDIWSVILSIIIWITLWGAPLYMLFHLIRTQKEQQIHDLILYGAGLYGCIVMLISTIVAFSLWLPFSYLG